MSEVPLYAVITVPLTYFSQSGGLLVLLFIKLGDYWVCSASNMVCSSFSGKGCGSSTPDFVSNAEHALLAHGERPVTSWGTTSDHCLAEM